MTCHKHLNPGSAEQKTSDPDLLGHMWLLSKTDNRTGMQCSRVCEPMMDPFWSFETAKRAKSDYKDILGRRKKGVEMGVPEVDE